MFLKSLLYLAEPKWIIFSDTKLLYVLMTATVEEPAKTVVGEKKPDISVDADNKNNNAANATVRVTRDVLLAYDMTLATLVASPSNNDDNDNDNNNDDNDKVDVLKPLWHCLLEKRNTSSTNKDDPHRMF